MKLPLPINLRHAPVADSNRSQAFTLIELLTVLVIIGIMTALAVPGLKMVNGNAVKSGSSQVANHLNLARQKAISERTRVRVLFSYGSVTSAAALPYTTYSTCIQTNKQNLSDPNGWVYLTGWSSLPQGAIFSSNSLALALSTNSTTPFPITGGASIIVPYLEIKATGALTTQNTVNIDVVEGSMVATSAGLKIGTTNGANKITVTMDPLLGRAKTL